MPPIQLAAIILVLAALGGLALASVRLSGKPRPPTWMALGHGLVAATGLVLLIYAVMTATAPIMYAQIAVGVLILAALGGATMFLLFHLKEKPLPIPLVIGHGAIAAIGVVMTLIAAFGS